MPSIVNVTIKAVGTSFSVPGLSGTTGGGIYTVTMPRDDFNTLQNHRANKYDLSGNIMGGGTFKASLQNFLGVGDSPNQYRYGP